MRHVRQAGCIRLVLDHIGTRFEAPHLSTVVFVHLGPEIPAYAAVAIRQAARFGATTIHLAAEKAALQRFALPPGLPVVPVALDGIELTPLHREFRAICPFNRSFRGGFWTFTTERFFFLAALLEKLGLESVIHLENDVMLYTEADALTEKLAELYEGVALPFDNDARAIPGIVFIRRPASLAALCETIVASLRRNPDPRQNDMTLLAAARRVLGPAGVDALPSLPQGYTGPWRSRAGHTTADASLYSRHQAEFGCIFDAAAIGQYLGGPDPRNGRRWFHFHKKTPSFDAPPRPGFINESALFDASSFTYAWTTDAKDRKIPLMQSGDETVPIANLHIHCKNLAYFASGAAS